MRLWLCVMYMLLVCASGYHRSWSSKLVTSSPYTQCATNIKSHKQHTGGADQSHREQA